MKHVLLCFGAYAAAVLETDPASWQSHTGISICPLYLVACLAAWTNPPPGAAVWGAVFGLIADALTSGPPGIETVLVATLAWCAAHLRQRHQWRSLLAHCLLSVALLAMLSLGSRILHSSAPRDGVAFSHLLLSCAAAAFATTLCGLLLLSAGRALRRFRPSSTVKPY